MVVYEAEARICFPPTWLDLDAMGLMPCEYAAVCEVRRGDIVFIPEGIALSFI